MAKPDEGIPSCYQEHWGIQSGRPPFHSVKECSRHYIHDICGRFDHCTSCGKQCSVVSHGKCMWIVLRGDSTTQHTTDKNGQHGTYGPPLSRNDAASWYFPAKLIPQVTLYSPTAERTPILSPYIFKCSRSLKTYIYINMNFYLYPKGKNNTSRFTNVNSNNRISVIILIAPNSTHTRTQRTKPIELIFKQFIIMLNPPPPP